MLTLMPLSGLHSALKRKNSKNYDFSRRGSLSVYDTYSLPTSKNSLRRFSSYEGLAPIFQQFLAQQQNNQQELTDGGSVEITYSPASSPSPSPPPPPPPPPEKRKRRGSLSLGKRLRKLSGVGLSLLGDNSSQSDESSSTGGGRRKCSVDDLDNLFAKIREQLDQLKNEDTEICQRVDELHSSVGDLYRERRVDQPQGHYHDNDTSGSVLTSSCENPSPRSPLADPTHSCRQSTTMPPNLSSGSLTVIRESSFELLDDELKDDSSDDEQSFEDYCRTNIPKLGTTRTAAAVKQSIKFSALDDVDLPAEHNDPKRYCLPNNLDLRPKSESAPQLEMIRNDLSDSSSSSSQRWSVISTQSDSVLITSKGNSYHSAHQHFEL